MQRIAGICLVGVMFGQLGFSAAKYYLGIAHPSWPFWMGLAVACVGMLAQAVTRARIGHADLWFLAFLTATILSFARAGASPAITFFSRLAGVCVLPYLCGRVVGTDARIPIARWVRVTAALYVVLMAAEYILDPGQFQGDRVYLFAGEREESGGENPGGDPTQFNLGNALGAAWITALVAMLFRTRPGTDARVSGDKLSGALLVIIPPLVLVAGSRNSAVAVAGVALLFLLWVPWVTWSRKMLLIFAPVAAFVCLFPLLPDDRKDFITEIPRALTIYKDFVYAEGCVQSVGIFNRVVLLGEAARLFKSAPLMGVGAGNYGLLWCGEISELGGPHSILAQVLAEDGIIGVVPFLALLSTIIRSFLAYIRRSPLSQAMEVWSLVGIWLFAMIQAQIIGNMFFDFHVFLLTGVVVSILATALRSTSRTHAEASA